MRLVVESRVYWLFLIAGGLFLARSFDKPYFLRVNPLYLFISHFGAIALPLAAYAISDARQIHALGLILYFVTPALSSFLISRSMGDMKPFSLASSAGLLVGFALAIAGGVSSVFIAGAAESSGVNQAVVDWLFFGGLAAIFLGTLMPAIFSFMLLLKRMVAAGKSSRS